jgi:lauroyl/myristoyl acyltransferase
VKLIVNLYKVSIEFIEAFNKYVPGLRFTDIEDKEKVVEFALIPLTTHYGNGKTGEAWYISERLKDSLYTNPSKKYLESIQKNNREWAKAEIDNSQCN